jgi:hypothetical protein
MGFFSEIRKKLEGGQGGWKETLENERKADEQKLREAEERFLKMDQADMDKNKEIKERKAKEKKKKGGSGEGGGSNVDLGF